MQPEGIVHALRQVCEALVPGGLVIDLQAIRPSGRVEIGGDPIGRINDDVFFARAAQAVAGLDSLVDEGLLARGPQIVFETLAHYDAGAELIAAITDSPNGNFPPNSRGASRTPGHAPSARRASAASYARPGGGPTRPSTDRSFRALSGIAVPDSGDVTQRLGSAERAYRVVELLGLLEIAEVTGVGKDDEPRIRDRPLELARNAER